MKRKFRKTILLSAIALSLPVAAQAATEQQALDACARALATDLGAAQGSPVGYRIGNESSKSSAMLRGFSTFHIDASNASTQEVVAKVDCTVSSSGEVVKMKMLHLNALSAEQRRQRGL